MNVISIDFDNTLYEKDKVIMKSLENVNKLFEDPDNFIVIYTSRSYSCFEFVRQTLLLNGIKFHALVCEKIRANEYIDDKNVGGLKWE